MVAPRDDRGDDQTWERLRLPPRSSRGSGTV
jgi:hypothetical protein